MASYLLDSSVLIDYLRGRPEVIDRITQLALEGHALGICAVNVAEVFSGMLEHERPPTERLLGSLDYLEITFDTARTAGQLQAQLRRQGSRAQLPDVLIGAVARALDATLLTANVKDFALPDLAVEALPASR